MGGKRTKPSFWSEQILRETPATRHLCAGTYVDRDFRDLVLQEVYLASRQRVAPSYGFDLVAVAAHARRAWVLDTAYQTSIITIVVTGAITNLAAEVMTICLLLALPLVGKILRTVPLVLRLRGQSMWSKLLRSPNGEDNRTLRHESRLLTLCVIGLVALVIVPIVVARKLSTPLTAGLAAAGAMTLMIMFFSVVVAAGRQWAVNNLRRTATLRPTSLTARMRVIDAQQSHRHVIYSNRPQAGLDPTPFLGSGHFRRRWPPETIRLLRRTTNGDPPEEYQAPPFQIGELIDHVKTEIAKLGKPQDLSAALPGFYVRDRLFTDERHALAVLRFLETDLENAEIEEITGNPYGRTEHYLEIGASETGEVVTTVFARFTIIGGALNMDIAMGALTPPPDLFRRVDGYKEGGPGAVIRAALNGMVTVSRETGQVWRLSQTPLLIARAVRARQDPTVVPKRGVVIGTRVSVREVAALPWQAPRAALVRPEVLRHKDLILTRLLEVTIRFLESKEVDVSEFKKQVTTIIKANVFNQDGTINIHDSAVGAQAQVNNQSTAGAGSAGGQEA